MNGPFLCATTASFLKSGRSAAYTSHAAAVIAGLALALTPPNPAHWFLLASLFCWLIQSWFALRVLIDASLFRVLAADPDQGGKQLDELLVTWKMADTVRDRSLVDRSQGALRLWRRQLVSVGVQCAALMAGLLWRMVTG